MEHIHQVHGVDVSWTHRPTLPRGEQQAHSSPALMTTKVEPRPSSHEKDTNNNNNNNNNNDNKSNDDDDDNNNNNNNNNNDNDNAQHQPRQTAPPDPAVQQNDAPKAPVSAQVVPVSSPMAIPSNDTATPPRSVNRRPSILSRSPSDKQANGDGGSRPSRRNSWISSISSKFSSQASPSAPQTSRSNANGVNAAPPAQTAKDQLPLSPSVQHAAAMREAAELQPYVPQKPKDPNASFFSSLTRRLSSNPQTGVNCRVNDKGGVCPRRVMNVDRNRERCLVPEFDMAKLRRVSFSVDVEIAAGPRYKDEDSAVSKQKKLKDKKVKERAEGEALKHPDAVMETKENSGNLDGSTDDVLAGSEADLPPIAEEPPSLPSSEEKPEKKQRTEEERRERKERKRRRAEESGQIPVELSPDRPEDLLAISQPSSVPASGTTTPRPQDRPTTDPVRIYRRCCQLRESPILKRITEQLMAPNCTMPDDPGVVTELRLSGSRMQLADVVTLSDWLAIVPVKRLLLEDADLSDESVRVILAGLLAAKKPEPIKRRNGTRCNLPGASGGIIEKLTLKNNPKITKVGWKYIALFLYMCRSIRAIDVSMIQFPGSTSSTTDETPTKTPKAATGILGNNADTAEILHKALAERLGGSQLEEMTMAECGLRTPQLRKVVDAATISGISRLVLAGNPLDDEGLECILQYVRSGVCHGLDLGSIDLRGRLGRLSEALAHKPDCPVWGLSLAGCNLDCDSLKDLFPALTGLGDFRFLDLSHNGHLFEGDVCALRLLRKYLPKLQNLKRFHLRDVGLNVKQAISLAEVLPEGPSLAHLDILDNPQISSLATSTDEDNQEEACALYASLTAAARISKSIVCIDVEVPCPEHGEVVKALAKQVVAYCLRNMDRTMSQHLTMPLATTLSKAHGVEDARYVTVPDVLLHLVGNLEGDPTVRDNGETAPDEDYIVGGNGLVKALQYFLQEEAIELRRASVIMANGSTTPQERQEHAGQEIKRKGKAKEVSKELLESARKLRARLQPSLVKEFAGGDEINYRRLSFLDNTLKGMIERFEDEYPETRLVPPSPPQPVSISSSLDSTADFGPLSSTAGSIDSGNSASLTNTTLASADFPALDSEDDDQPFSTLATGTAIAAAQPAIPGNTPNSRKNSDVSLASRALGLEEGRIHRLGHQVRQDMITKTSSHNNNRQDDATLMSSLDADDAWAEGSRLSEMTKKMVNLSGPELRAILERSGWEGVMESLGANLEELKLLQMKDPVGWEQFRESQLKAFANKKIGGVGDCNIGGAASAPASASPDSAGGNDDGAGIGVAL